jgi:hypothetical protein
MWDPHAINLGGGASGQGLLLKRSGEGSPRSDLLWMKEKEIKGEKVNKKKGKGKKKRKENDIMDISPITQTGEAVLPNVSSKSSRFTLICFINTTTTRAATATTVPKAPLI